MIGGHACSQIGLQLRAAQTTRMAFDQFTAVKPGVKDLLHPFAAVQHAVHIHHFRHAAHFGPG
ncbi:hypothetical protein D3C76_1327320 [compost metagenome]